MAQAATSLKLDNELKNRIQRLAEHRHRSAHSVMLEAITQYVEREERLEQFRDEMELVWDEYQATGVHAKGKDVLVWMESWFTDQEKATPRCQP